MEHSTVGQSFYREFRLPLVYTGTQEIPRPEDDYFGILCAERGIVSLEDSSGKRYIQAPVAIFVKPSHSIQNISVPEGKAHSLIFRPQAVNTTVPTSVPSPKADAMREYFFFSPFAAIPDSGYTAKPLPPGMYATISELCSKLDDNLNRTQREFWPCLSRSYFLEILILLERNWYIAPDATESSQAESGDSFRRIIDFLHTNYGDEHTLESLASRFATNRTTLNKRFNESCGMSAMAYLNTVRVDIASSLLRNTELKIADIASRTGFGDESYFSRTFKKKTGTSPVTYRKSFPNPYS